MNNKEICINKIYENCNSKIKEYQTLNNTSIVPERKIELKAKAQFSVKLINIIDNITNRESIDENKVSKEGIKEECKDELLEDIKEDIYNYFDMDLNNDD